MCSYTSDVMAKVREDIRQFFVKEGIGGLVVVAVSGGVDSTALLLALHELRDDPVKVVAAHVNHHLRGEDSDADEAFVRDLCGRLGVDLHVADGTLDAVRVGERGIEAAARETRYARLQAIRASSGARWIATAHQKNDQAETVLLRLLTGSGLAGLRGIHPVRSDGVIRPMLGVTRGEIEAFLAERQVVARHDRSNDDPRFLRNRIRVLLRELGGTDALASAADQARAQWPLLERAIDEADAHCVASSEMDARFVHWPDELWLRGALLQRHIRRLDPQARDFDAARIAAEMPSLKRLRVTKHLELIRKGHALVLRRPPEPFDAFEVDLTEDRPAHIRHLGVTVHVARRKGSSGAGRQLIQLPFEGEPAFKVRNRRTGDRFQPLGLGTPKRLKEFLINRKIDAGVRDRLPLLVWNGEIVWIAGVEVSERFRVHGDGGVLYEVWTDERDQPDLQR